MLERLRGHAALLVERPVRFVDLSGLVEKAEVRPLHVEADRRDDPFFSGKCAKIDAMIHSIALVFVAKPDTPVMLRCAASGPIRKSASR